MNTPDQTPHVVVTPPTLPATLWSPSEPARVAASQGSGNPMVGVGALEHGKGRRIDPAGAGEVWVAKPADYRSSGMRLVDRMLAHRRIKCMVSRTHATGSCESCGVHR